jgi:hypothetical protein
MLTYADECMHSVVLQRSQFVGGWVEGAHVTFEDFLAAAAALRRALRYSVYLRF